jgi:hypothetical protein
MRREGWRRVQGPREIYLTLFNKQDLIQGRECPVV